MKWFVGLSLLVVLNVGAMEEGLPLTRTATMSRMPIKDTDTPEDEAQKKYSPLGSLQDLLKDIKEDPQDDGAESDDSDKTVLSPTEEKEGGKSKKEEPVVSVARGGRGHGRKNSFSAMGGLGHLGLERPRSGKGRFPTWRQTNKLFGGPPPEDTLCLTIGGEESPSHIVVKKHTPSDRVDSHEGVD